MRLVPALLLAGLVSASPILAQESILPSVSADTPTSWVVDSIRVEGLRSVAEGILLARLGFAKGDTLSGDALTDRTRESLKALMGLGLLDDAQLSWEQRGPGSALAVLRVRELATVGEVRFQGNRKLKDKELKELGRLEAGAVLQPAAVERDRQAFLKEYREKGYLLASVAAEKGAFDSVTGSRDLTWKIEEKSKVRVGRIEIVGNTRLKRVKILKAMRVKEKRWWRTGEFVEDSLALDLESIRELYREKGYLDARVDSHSVTYRPDGKRLDIRLNVTEGIRYVRGRVSFTGNDLMNERQLRGQLTLDSGAVMNQKKLDAEEQNLRDLYLEEGRIFVQVKPVRTFRDSVIDILYAIQEGKPASVAKVEISGNTKTRDKVIRRELRLFPGDLYRQSLLMRSFREVMQLNYFDQVVPDLQPNEDGTTVDLVFKVTEKERGTGTLSAGAAYSQRDGFVGTFGTQIPNVLGTGRRADLSVEFGEYKQSYSVGGSEPWFMDTPTRLGASVFYTHTKDQYSADRDATQWGFTTSLGRRLKWPDDYFSASTAYTFSFNEYGIRGDKVGMLQSDGIESSVSVSLTRDDKDLPLFPTSGSVYQVSLRKVGGLVGGDFDYVEGRSKIKWYFPTIGKLVLGLEAQGGVLDGDVIQAKDLYTMGGTLGYSGQLRGYAAGSIGNYRIGRSYLSTTAELRYPIADQTLYLLAFTDAGNVFGPLLTERIDDGPNQLGSPWNEINLGDLKRDWGFGFRLNIPMMGILGFDFAWGLDPNEGYLGQATPNKGFHANFIIEQPF